MNKSKKEGRYNEYSNIGNISESVSIRVQSVSGGLADCDLRHQDHMSNLHWSPADTETAGQQSIVDNSTRLIGRLITAPTILEHERQSECYCYTAK